MLYLYYYKYYYIQKEKAEESIKPSLTPHDFRNIMIEDISQHRRYMLVWNAFSFCDLACTFLWYRDHPVQLLTGLNRYWADCVNLIVLASVISKKVAKSMVGGSYFLSLEMWWVQWKARQSKGGKAERLEGFSGYHYLYWWPRKEILTKSMGFIWCIFQKKHME